MALNNQQPTNQHVHVDSCGRVVNRWALSCEDFSFTPHCLKSLGCIIECLAIDSEGLGERIVYRSVIAARLNASQRSWTSVCTNRSARGVIVSAFNGQVKQLTFNVQYPVNLTVQSTYNNPPGRPVHTKTSSTSLGSIQPRNNYGAINYSFT